MREAFECPVCGRSHRFHWWDRPNDLTCTDNETSQIREFDGADKTGQLTANRWNMNRFSLREDSYDNAGLRDVVRKKTSTRGLRNW